MENIIWACIILLSCKGMPLMQKKAFWWSNKIVRGKNFMLVLEFEKKKMNKEEEEEAP